LRSFADRRKPTAQISLEQAPSTNSDVQNVNYLTSDAEMEAENAVAT
jgi:hypothetical protein